MHFVVCLKHEAAAKLNDCGIWMVQRSHVMFLTRAVAKCSCTSLKNPYHLLRLYYYHRTKKCLQHMYTICAYVYRKWLRYDARWSTKSVVQPVFARWRLCSISRPIHAHSLYHICPEGYLKQGDAQLSEEAFDKFCGTVKHGHIEFHGNYKTVWDTRPAAAELSCSWNGIFLHEIFNRFFFTWPININFSINELDLISDRNLMCKMFVGEILKLYIFLARVWKLKG